MLGNVSTADRRVYVGGVEGALELTERTYPHKVSERIARAILGDAECNHLQVGDQLPSEAQMAKIYAVGRVSVREALRILEVHGVVEIRNGRGNGPRLERLKARSVATTLRLYLQIRGATYADLLDTRLALDPTIAARAAERATSTERQQLVEKAEVLQLIDKNDYSEIGAHGLRFAVAVGTCAHNPCMAMLAHALADIQTLRMHTWYAREEYWDVEAKGILRLARAIHRRDRRSARETSDQKLRHEIRFAKQMFPEVLDEVVRWN
jgi:DNA-binding FadR family transcriptional regulator